MRRAGLIISVGGGKGGVGKSLIAANLAATFAGLGRRTTLVDADLGAANQHTLFGIDRPGPTLHGLTSHTIDSLADAELRTCVEGLGLIPGSGAVDGAANPNHAQKQRLMRQIAAIPSDIVIIDLGAGITFNVIDLFLVGDVRLLVVAPQLTSLQNAYGAAKAAVMRAVGRCLGEGPAMAARDEVPSHDTERVAGLLTRVGRVDAASADRARGELARFGMFLFGNQIAGDMDVHAIEALSRMLRDFLHVEAPVVGLVPPSLGMQRSVSSRRPFVVDAPDSPSASEFRRIARSLLASSVTRRTTETEQDAPARAGVGGG